MFEGRKILLKNDSEMSSEVVNPLRISFQLNLI